MITTAFVDSNNEPIMAGQTIIDETGSEVVVGMVKGRPRVALTQLDFKNGLHCPLGIFIVSSEFVTIKH